MAVPCKVRAGLTSRPTPTHDPTPPPPPAPPPPTTPPRPHPPPTTPPPAPPPQSQLFQHCSNTVGTLLEQGGGSYFSKKIRKFRKFPEISGKNPEKISKKITKIQWFVPHVPTCSNTVPTLFQHCSNKCSNMFQHVPTLFQHCSNTATCVPTCSNMFQHCSNMFQQCSNILTLF